MDGVLAEQVDWYEATLPVTERKRRGHFSTPQLLVERILDACGYTPAADLAPLRVLDPACGSGNFLAGAIRRLVAFGTQSQITQQELARLIQRNIWGFDPDPISCLLTELQLSAIHSMPCPLHIHQADGLALPWNSQPCVDLFLANPPYLAAKNMDLSAYRCEQQYGQTDSYLLFLRLGLRVVRPGGWLGLVLPDPVLARANAAKERADLLNQCSIHQIWHLAHVFPAHVGAVVIVAQKNAPESTHSVTWVREKWGAFTSRFVGEKDAEMRQSSKDEHGTGQGEHGTGQGEHGTGQGDHKGRPYYTPTWQVKPVYSMGDHKGRSGKLLQALFLRQPGAELRYLLNSERGQGIERLRAYFEETPAAERQLAPLSDFLSIRRGEELGRKSSCLVHHDMASTSRYFNADQVYYPVLRGGRDVRPYAISFDGWWIERKAISKPLDRYLASKLLVVKSTGHLQAALDMQGHVALQTLYVLHLRTPEASADELYFFLALLNSRLLQTYVSMLYTAYKWVQPQIEQHVLAHLPVPIIDPGEKQQIVDNARWLVRACSEVGPVVEWGEHIQRMYEEQERAICALYTAALH